MEQWASYFTATTSASAALAGLIFVSVSLNLKKILSIKYLPGRAMGSLALLTNILIISSLCLVPQQTFFWLGIEILMLGATLWIIITRRHVNMFKNIEKEYKYYYLQNMFLTQLSAVPYLIAGVCLILKYDWGLYCLIPGITFSFIKSLIDSWVLLVEINR